MVSKSTDMNYNLEKLKIADKMNTPIFSFNELVTYAKAVDFYDGDTFNIIISYYDLIYHLKARMFGYDSPEMKPSLSIKNRDEIKTIHLQNDEIREKIVHTDVGTFKFIANSLNIPLDKAVNYFIWSIMAVFDPLAVILLIAANTSLGNLPSKAKGKTLLDQWNNMLAEADEAALRRGREAAGDPRHAADGTPLTDPGPARGTGRSVMVARDGRP